MTILDHFRQANTKQRIAMLSSDDLEWLDSDTARIVRSGMLRKIRSDTPNTTLIAICNHLCNSSRWEYGMQHLSSRTCATILRLAVNSPGKTEIDLIKDCYSQLTYKGHLWMIDEMLLMDTTRILISCLDIDDAQSFANGVVGILKAFQPQ